MSRGPLVAGLDIGGTKTLAVLVDAEGEVLARARVATGGDGTEGVLAAARRALEAITEEGGASSGDLIAAGVGIPGLVDADRGTVTHAVNLGIDGRPFAIGPRLAETLRVPVAVENDVNLAALGAAVALGGASGRPGTSERRDRGRRRGGHRRADPPRRPRSRR